MPVAPGTWGSLPPAVVFGLLVQFHASAVAIAVVMAALIVVASAACIICVPAVATIVGKTDPGEVVIDEVAGQAVAFLIVPWLLPAEVSSTQVWVVAGVGFLLFRVIDITKPWPIKKLEAFPAGWGVLADDLLAGVFAAAILAVGVRVWMTT